MRVTSKEVLEKFAECQKSRDPDIKEWQKKQILNRKNWELIKVNPKNLKNPYQNFGRGEDKVNFSKSHLPFPEALSEIIKNGSDNIKKLISQPLKDPPPIFIFKEGNEYFVWDGCGRTLTACFHGFDSIDAFIGH
jgi:hypothetical protein